MISVIEIKIQEKNFVQAVTAVQDVAASGRTGTGIRMTGQDGDFAQDVVVV